MTELPFGPAPHQVHPFAEHVALLRLFLAHRDDIVDRIETILNAQRKPVQHLQDRPLLSHQFETCFFAHPAVSASQSRLRGQLEAAHSAAGFRPRAVQHVHNDLIHPAEMMSRGFHFWQQTRWPGRNARLHYAHTLFNLYVVRYLQFLSMRLWDDSPIGAGPELPGGRLAEIQGVLNDLWRSSPADQPAIVRDARWLLPLALSLITDDLEPYFEVALQAAESLPAADALEIQKAHARMLGGHLTSQIRHYCIRDGVSISDPHIVVGTRTANALDLALLVQALVGLLKGYARALSSGDERERLDLAGAIYQSISADPELFLHRVDLMRAYSMIEHVFIATDAEGHVAYSPLGQRHVRLLEAYGALLDELIQPLRRDFPRFQPAGGYSPYGVMFGLPSNLIEHMALKTLQRDAETRFSLEDVFRDDVFRDDVFRDEVFDDALNDHDTSASKLAWVNGWRDWPHIDPEVRRQYEYPQQFAQEIYDRIGQQLMQRESSANAGEGAPSGRLHIADESDSTTSEIPELPIRHFASSDKHFIAEHNTEPCDQSQLLYERREGHFLVSYETPDGWIALKKDLLTEVLGGGRDARVVGLPLRAAQVLRLMCPGLVIPGRPPN